MSQNNNQNIKATIIRSVKKRYNRPSHTKNMILHDIIKKNNWKNSLASISYFTRTIAPGSKYLQKTQSAKKYINSKAKF